MTDATKSEIPAAATESRIACATALRELGHSIVGHAADDRLLDRITAFVSEATAELDSAPCRSRPVSDMKRRLFDDVPADGATMEHYPDCIVSGLANPMGIAITCHREGDDAVATVSFGAAFEGAPGRAHGGIVAAVFDDVMGFVLSMVRTPAFTGRLAVSYLAPTPLGTELEFRARLRDRDGRKLWIDGEATCDGQRFAESEGLFISVPLDRLST
ncbi:MAG: PaaI family thioesterase [Ilumatobacter sp.]|uniref:PaaI family thioesterase n=1 Tax=Ilumatobacter sp. TaxID=1967498 RepID=UPI0032995D01